MASLHLVAEMAVKTTGQRSRVEHLSGYRATTVTVKPVRFKTGITVPLTVPFWKFAGGGTGRAPFRVTVTMNREDTDTVVSPRVLNLVLDCTALSCLVSTQNLASATRKLQ